MELSQEEIKRILEELKRIREVCIEALIYNPRRTSYKRRLQYTNILILALENKLWFWEAVECYRKWIKNYEDVIAVESERVGEYKICIIPSYFNKNDIIYTKGLRPPDRIDFMIFSRKFGVTEEMLRKFEKMGRKCREIQ